MSTAGLAPVLSLPETVFTSAASYLDIFELARILGVSREWRARLLADGSLWQRITVDYREHPRFSVTKLLPRSHSLPIDLRLKRIPPREYAALLLGLKQHIPRVRLLKLWFTHERAFEYALQYLLQELTMPAPILESFEGALEGAVERLDSEHLAYPGDLFGGHAPRLLHFTLDLEFWKPIDCPALREIKSVGAYFAQGDLDSIEYTWGGSQ